MISAFAEFRSRLEGRDMMKKSPKRLMAILMAGAALSAASRLAFAEGNEYVGQTPPEISIAELLNAAPEMPKTLAELRGRVVLLEFWATWCPPCRRMIPHMQELSEKYSQKGLQILSVTKEKPEVVKPFVKENNMKYTIGLDVQGKTMRTYGITAIPTAYLIGADGKVIWQGHPSELKENQIEEALKMVEKK
jgi:thiol-disulfide isomerase/thioredoxin